jgi:hypothetical protein
MIRFACPLCQGMVTASKAQAGLAVVCPSCRSPVTAPAPAEPPGGRLKVERIECVCGSKLNPEWRDRVSPTGWTLMVAMFFLCTPFFWVGFFVRERGLYCPDCSRKIRRVE